MKYGIWKLWLSHATCSSNYICMYINAVAKDLTEGE